MDTDNLSYERYLELQKALETHLSKFPQEHGYEDLCRIPLARKAFESYSNGQAPTMSEEKAYFVKSLKPKSGSEITKQEFDKLKKIYGNSISKISLIDSGLSNWISTSKKQENLLATGGACALESIDTRIIQYLSRNKNGKALVKDYVEQMFARFPTWTQVTGTIIPTCGVNVMYDETFPWYLRIKEYGLKDPEVMTQQVYDSIYSAVRRFIRLHDPNSKVVKIPFSSLQLDTKGYFDIWYKETQTYLSELEETYNLEHIQYNPESFYKYWLEYTYFGPQILDINKKLIKKLYPDLYKAQKLHNATIHVRGKQLDHLDVERVNLWMHKVILGKAKKTKRINTLLMHPFQRLGVALYMWRRDTFEQYPSIGFAGMSDFNYCGKVVHEDGVFHKPVLKHLTAQDTLHSSLLDSPLRLHSGNLNQVISFLERFKSPNAVSFSKEILINLTQTRGKLDQIQTKIETLHTFIDSFVCGEQIFTAALAGKREISGCADSKTLERHMKNLYIRTKADKDIINYVKINLGKDRADELITEFFRSVRFNEKTKKIEISASDVDPDFIQMMQYIVHHRKMQDMKRCEKLLEEKEAIDTKLKQMFSQLSKDISQHQSDNLTEHVNILPLGANMFVSYMQQFLFIPSIRNAYLHLVQIESDHGIPTPEKEQIIIQVIQKIFPIIARSLTYVLQGGDYPWKERFEFQYDAI